MRLDTILFIILTVGLIVVGIMATISYLMVLRLKREMRHEEDEKSSGRPDI